MSIWPVETVVCPLLLRPWYSCCLPLRLQRDHVAPRLVGQLAQLGDHATRLGMLGAGVGEVLDPHGEAAPLRDAGLGARCGPALVDDGWQFSGVRVHGLSFHHFGFEYMPEPMAARPPAAPWPR